LILNFEIVTPERIFFKSIIFILENNIKPKKYFSYLIIIKKAKKEGTSPPIPLTKYQNYFWQKIPYSLCYSI